MRGSCGATGWRTAVAVALLGGVSALSPSTANPTDTPAPPPESVLAAVGWLGWGDPARAHAGCTGTLVAPDVVLTAAHCLTRDERTPPSNPGAILFLAGRDGPDPAAARHGRSVVLTAPRVLLGGQMPYDLALVTLDAPVAGVTPLALSAAPLPAAAAVIVGYPMHAPGQRDIETGCAARDTAGVVILSCTARPGYSGGPVLVPDAGHWRVVATVVARMEQGAAPGALAVIPADDLRRAIAGR